MHSLDLDPRSGRRRSLSGVLTFVGLLAACQEGALDIDDMDTTGEPPGSSSGADTTTDPAEPVEPTLSGAGVSRSVVGPIGLDMCCDVGCSGTLVQSHTGDVVVSFNGAQISTQSGGTLQLWDAVDLTRIARFSVEGAPKMVGDRLLYRKSGVIRLIDTADGGEIAAVPLGTATNYGLAPDAGYLWTAGDAGLTIYETDGSVRWSVAGAYAGARVHDLPDELHVYDADVAPQTIQRFTAAAGGLTTHGFVGDYPRWFGDNGRFWTMFNQTQTHRFFAADGTLLFSGVGYPSLGWGTRFLLANKFYDVSAPNVAIGSLGFSPVNVMGPIIASGGEYSGYVQWTRIDETPMKVRTIDLPEQKYEHMSISIAGEKWVVGGEDGWSLESKGRSITRGGLGGLAGAASGRLAFAYDGRIHAMELLDDCTTKQYPTFPGAGAFRMSANGEVLVARTTYSSGPLQSPKPGTRFHRLPDGKVVAQTQPGLTSDMIVDHDISDEGTVWSRYWFNTHPAGHAHSASLPFGVNYTSAVSDVLPKVSPDGMHVVESDGVTTLFDDWVGDRSRIYVNDLMNEDPIAEFDGIAHGFIDDEHILVGVYVDPDDTFAGMRIVGLDGLDVQDVPLPDIRRFLRLGTGEILAHVPWPVSKSIIYDPWTGAELWVSPDGAPAELAGDDFVLFNLGDRIEVLRWR